MLTATVGAAIDNRTNSLLKETLFFLMDNVQGVANFRRAHVYDIIPYTVLIDFDRIVQDDCRQAFLDISTTWGLDEEVVDALMDVGAAMLADLDLVRDLAGPPSEASASAQAAQERAKKACDQLTKRMSAS